MPITIVIVSHIFFTEIDECANDQCNGFPCDDLVSGHTCHCVECGCAQWFTDMTKCWPGETFSSLVPTSCQTCHISFEEIANWVWSVHFPC